MKKIMKAFVFVAIVSALAMTLCSCGGGQKEDYTAKLAGTYDLAEIKAADPSESMSATEVKELLDYGLVCFVNLNTDGTYEMFVIDEQMTGKWSTNDGINITFKYDDTDYVDSFGVVSGDTIAFHDDGETDEMIFTKGEPKRVADYL